MTTMDKIMQAVDELKNMALVEQYGDTDDLELSAQIEDVRDLTASAIADAQREWVDAIESVGWGRDLHPQEVAARILGMAESHNRMQAAIADARREGAEQMREAAADEAIRRGQLCGDRTNRDLVEAILALPLPTGPRQAVRLTEEQIGRMYCAVLGEEYIEPTDVEADKEAHAALMRVTRAIETAVLAANGIGGRE